MDKTKRQIIIAFAGLIILSLYSPLLELLKKNPNIQELYGFEAFDFFLLIAASLFLPWLITVFVSLRFAAGPKITLAFWLSLSAVFFVNPLNFGTKFVALIFFGLFLLSVLKKPINFLKVLSFVAIFALPDALYKTFRLYKKHVGFHFHHDSAPKFPKKADAPSNIFFFLLDGTDLTSSYLDQEGYPRKDLFPGMHETFKADFQWFPETRSNAPQTFLSIPTLVTSTLHFKDAETKFKQSQEMFSYLQNHYAINGFFYTNYYSSFCSHNRLDCYPFRSKETSFEKRGVFILLSMYLHQLSWGKTTLPFKLGKDFVPEAESYSFNNLYQRMDAKGTSGQLYYVHVFRRAFSKLLRFDKEFEKFVARLKKKGLYDSSMIVITSDHGLDFTQTGHIYGRLARFTPRVFRIPLAIKFPGTHQGQISFMKAQTIDILPTMLNGVYSDENVKKLSLEGVDLRSPERDQIQKRKHLVTCENDSTIAEFITEHKLSKCIDLKKNH